MVVLLTGRLTCDLQVTG